MDQVALAQKVRRLHFVLTAPSFELTAHSFELTAHSFVLTAHTFVLTAHPDPHLVLAAPFFVLTAHPPGLHFVSCILFSAALLFVLTLCPAFCVLQPHHTHALEEHSGKDTVTYECTIRDSAAQRFGQQMQAQAAAFARPQQSRRGTKDIVNFESTIRDSVAQQFVQLREAQGGEQHSSAEASSSVAQHGFRHALPYPVSLARMGF